MGLSVAQQIMQAQGVGGGAELLTPADVALVHVLDRHFITKEDFTADVLHGRMARGFPDVPPSHPFHPEITWAAGEGIVQGYDDGTFRPSAAVTRQAMAAFLHRHSAHPDTSPPADPTEID